jgi:hypothetical protein
MIGRSITQMETFTVNMNARTVKQSLLQLVLMIVLAVTARSQTVTSHSSTNRFNGCPFAYKLNKDGLRKVVVGPEANFMVWGKAGHSGLEALYSGKGDPIEAFSRAYPVDLDPENQVWSREGGIRTLEAYQNYYSELDKQWQILDVELRDNVDNPTLILDLVARHNQSGSIYFWDHKFKAKSPFGANKRYEIDSQISRYTDFCLERYGDCAGAVINLIVPGYRQRAYKGEPAGWHFKFERVIVGRTPQQLDYWRQSQAEWECLIDYCDTNGTYPKHLGYNCSFCSFYELCYSANDDEVRDTLYTTEPEEEVDLVVIDEE